MSVLFKILHKLRVLYWHVCRPITNGVRIILIKNNKVVLLKHVYENGWYFPGGGVKRGETLEKAIKREVKEEVSGKVNKMELFGVYTNLIEGKTDHISVFVSSDFKIGISDSSEIATVKEFNINKLPTNITPGTRRRIEEYKRKKHKIFGKW